MTPPLRRLPPVLSVAVSPRVSWVPPPSHASVAAGSQTSLSAAAGGPIRSAGPLRARSTLRAYDPTPRSGAAVARSNRPVEIAARHRSISSAVARPAPTRPSRICSIVARSRTAACRSRHREVGVRPDLLEAERTEDTGEGAAEGEVDPAPSEQHPESGVQLVGQCLLRAGLVDAGEWLERGIGVLDDQPAAGAQDISQPGEHPLSSGQVDEHKTGVDEVERPGGWVICCDVMAEHAEGPLVGRTEPREVDVAGQDRAVGTDPVGHPSRDLRPPGADLPTLPAGTDAGVVEDTAGGGVEQLGQRSQPGARLRLPVVEQVLVAQESTRRRKLRSPRPRNSTTNATTTGYTT